MICDMRCSVRERLNVEEETQHLKHSICKSATQFQSLSYNTHGAKAGTPHRSIVDVHVHIEHGNPGKRLRKILHRVVQVLLNVLQPYLCVSKKGGGERKMLQRVKGRGRE